MSRRYAIMALVVLSAALLGCRDTGVAPPGDEPDNFVDIQPAPPDQAALMALYLSGEIRPPIELVIEIHDELEAIRSLYAEEHPMLGFEGFRLPWEPGAVLLQVDGPTGRAILDGTYDAWDALNVEFHLLTLSTNMIEFGWCSLRFAEPLHPVPLGERYAELPGILQAEPNGICGDGSNVFPRTIEGGRSYLYYRGSGDCLSGCIYREYWYVRVIGGEPSFVGYWNRYEDPAEPGWWMEAELNRLQYR